LNRSSHDRLVHPPRGSVYLRVVRASSVIAIGLGFSLLYACGGGAQASAPKSSGDESSGGDWDEGASPSGDAPMTAEERVESVCADETCTPCGEGFCPSGFYCDESREPAACSWLPACVEDASCECVKRTLGAGCECESRSGGSFVSCS
jgi:hypothetical protein